MKYFLRENRSGVEIGREKTNLGLSTWNKDKMTRFVIHGMIENYKAEWYNQMRQAFFNYVCYIFVDYLLNL
jgi:hypothetical protein